MPVGKNVQLCAWGNMGDDIPVDQLKYYCSGLADQEIVALLDAGVDGSLLLAMLEDKLDGHRALVCPRDQVRHDTYLKCLGDEVFITCPPQGGLGISKESLTLLLKLLSDGKGFVNKLKLVDGVEKDIEAAQQVRTGQLCS